MPNAHVNTEVKVIAHLRQALADVEALCGSPQFIAECRDSADMSAIKIAAIYDVARATLEDIDVPSSPLYWSR